MDLNISKFIVYYLYIPNWAMDAVYRGSLLKFNSPYHGLFLTILPRAVVFKFNLIELY